jgi:hypothetical protein
MSATVAFHENPPRRFERVVGESFDSVDAYSKTRYKARFPISLGQYQPSKSNGNASLKTAKSNA